MLHFGRYRLTLVEKEGDRFLALPNGEILGRYDVQTDRLVQVAPGFLSPVKELEEVKVAEQTPRHEVRGKVPARAGGGRKSK